MPKDKSHQMDFRGLELIADEFTGALNGDAADVSVAAGTDGLSAGTVQSALQALATRVQALEDAT
jgi:hypothetical protein